jgi:hypothetical protein
MRMVAIYAAKAPAPPERALNLFHTHIYAYHDVELYGSGNGWAPRFGG